MADPIRPHAWPNLPAAPQRQDGRSAAQRAFFEQALGRAAPQAAPAPASPPPTTLAAREAPAARGPDLRIEMPQSPSGKILRPGSIIDIKV